MKIYYKIAIALCGLLLYGLASGQVNGSASGHPGEKIKNSLVFIQVSSYSYDPLQPWRHRNLQQKSGYGCAVGDYEVLTPARVVADASFISVRRLGNTRLIPATIRTIDYDSNLALLQLDKTAAGAPLPAIRFQDAYRKGANVDYYWISSQGRFFNARGYIDRVEMVKTPLSYMRLINYIIGNVSQQVGQGQLFCLGTKIIGMGFWYNGSIKQAGIIPAEVIGHFLRDAGTGSYQGFPALGFRTETLLDPVFRSYLKLPDDMTGGVYINKVFTLGTAHNLLHAGDVLLSVDGIKLDAYGRFIHDRYGKITYNYLVSRHVIGDTILLDLWRGGKAIKLKAKTENFSAQDMLIPYYEYGLQPEYMVIGGFVFQTLTRKYLTAWGDGWASKVNPLFYKYYSRDAFNPTTERKRIVILSYVLPANINLGYQTQQQLVVKTCNGMKIHSLQDMYTARKLNPDAKFDIIEFEQANPTVVLPRSELPRADEMLARIYGITELQNVR